MSASLLHNAHVLTMAAGPAAEAVAVRDGVIVAVGPLDKAVRAVGAGAERIDCEGGVLLPAFIDAHCHLLSYAASLRSADCTGARRIEDIVSAVRKRAGALPSGSWVRAFGYEETALEEGRHPTRRDLDAATSAHPVRLIHRSGHASVLNSTALGLVGIDIASEEPPGGAVDRQLGSGEPSGLLLGMERRIDAVVPPLPYEELAAAVGEASRRLLAAGVTCLQDATHTNGPAEWQLFERLITDGALPLDVVLMEGWEHMGALPEEGAGGRRLRRGPVKIMLHELGDERSPGEAELAAQVAAVHAEGRQVAIHATGEGAVAAATAAIEAALAARPRSGHRHRIEHCSLLPDGLAATLARLGVVVVSQPSFLFDRGERYLQLVPPERQRALYAFRTLDKTGVPIAAGSDAPVSRPAPMASVAAAVGRRIAPEQAVDVVTALHWWTAGAAHAAFLEGERGALRPGLRADLVLLPADLLSLEPDALRTVATLGVWREGVQVAPKA